MKNFALALALTFVACQTSVAADSKKAATKKKADITFTIHTYASMRAYESATIDGGSREERDLKEAIYPPCFDVYITSGKAYANAELQIRVAYTQDGSHWHKVKKLDQTETLEIAAGITRSSRPPIEINPITEEVSKIKAFRFTFALSTSDGDVEVNRIMPTGNE